MIKIALVGNIASGKSTVEKFLAQNNFKVFDCDKIAHKILEENIEIKEFFRTYDVFDSDKINREKLGKLVFGNKDLLKNLENIIYPLVKIELKRIFEKYKNENVGRIYKEN